MCGICGAIDINGAAQQAGQVIHRMTAAMLHRGPDDEGHLIGPLAAPQAAIGMRRLSIIDLPGGHQPVFNEEGDVALVFNGEIYNFVELRAQLELGGHSFRTRSDTEVIVHAYEEWGEDCLRHLRGMFALALLDMRGRGKSEEWGGPRMLLARDRLGIKPLYYSQADGVLLFASEVRTLLASGCVPRRLSSEALDSYLLFGSVCEPMTLVEGIFSLPPGHFMTFPVGAPLQAIRPRAYWTFGEAAQPLERLSPMTLGSAAQKLRPLLEETVSRHLTADVPLGIFLSSGLDSTALVALAKGARAGLHTFTVIFEEQDFSEAELARQTAKRFGTRHEEFLLRGGDILEHLDDAVSAFDQPSMDGINTYFVSWAAHRAGLKVALSGLGGDEVFGGYSTFSSTPRAARLAAVGSYVPKTLRSLTAMAVGRAGTRGNDAARKLAALWEDGGTLPHPYFFLRALFTPEQMTMLRCKPASRHSHRDSPPTAPWRQWLAESAKQAASLDSFAAVSCMESRSYMAQTLLRDTDSVSMTHSLEVRVPMLDHVLVEFVAQLPGRVKWRPGLNKALLVESLRELLPNDVAQQGKRTFTLPWEHWLRGPLAQRVQAGLSSLAPSLAGYLQRENVRAIWTAFESRKTNWSRPWSLYVLNEWCRRHFDDSSAGVESSAGWSQLGNTV